MPNTLFILNDPPYGTERSYNGLRLAGALSKREGEAVKIFLMGDAASCAKKGQKVPPGYYNIEVMAGNVARHGGEELTTWVQWANRTRGGRVVRSRFRTRNRTAPCS